VRYLLDVNALLALGLEYHQFHRRVALWLLRLRSRPNVELATCSITELGFVRVLSRVPSYGYRVSEAQALLGRVKGRSIVEFTFLPDTQDLSDLPNWVNSHNQLTDGHLVQLANAQESVFATLDKRIPDAFLIPD
jgi:predicted nucleic acid-binding protein